MGSECYSFGARSPSGILKPQDICNLGGVSSEWRAFATSEAVWLVLSRTVHLRPLPAALAGDSDEGWAKEPPAVKSQLLQEYIPTFAVRQRIRQLCRRLKGGKAIAKTSAIGCPWLTFTVPRVNGELPEDLAEFFRLCDGFDKEALYFAEAAPGGVLAFRVTRLLPLSELAAAVATFQPASDQFAAPSPRAWLSATGSGHAQSVVLSATNVCFTTKRCASDGFMTVAKNGYHFQRFSPQAPNTMEQVAQEVMGSRRPEVEAQVEEVPMRVWKELEEGQQAPVVGKWRYQAMVVVMKGRESRNGEKWPLTHTGRYLKLGRRSDDGVQGQPRRGTRIWRTSADAVGAGPSAFAPKAEGAVGFFGELWSSAGSGRAERGIFGEWTLTRQTSCFLDYLQDYVSLLEGLPSQWAEQSLLTTGRNVSASQQKLLHDGRVLADSEEITSPVDLLVVLLPIREASAQEMQRFQNAAIHGDVRVMKEMLQSCHDPNCSQGLTPLAVAACCGHLDVVELLLEAGADRNKGDERTGLTALALACQNGRLEVARFLLESGADKDQSTKTGFTPLFAASCHGHIEVVRMLLSAGVNLDIVVESEKFWECGTPILTACQKGHVEIARLLVEAGSNLIFRDAATV
ncbi:Ankyrin repeat and KH domain-containing protein mask [Symbiodinium microadriaticum]|uniref:Ankyrin repeat and KH domain-containing protein mask n=1 Tax=Symbiodinium microadriaticum TaxID=2951 RepID=A0A1Q9CCU4_SYMMI|nr:Ankyrin repeat and KH domain-containing protein mask [Symbiodinium microadriaticum]